jgi:hypothetical protein
VLFIALFFSPLAQAKAPLISDLRDPEPKTIRLVWTGPLQNPTEGSRAFLWYGSTFYELQFHRDQKNVPSLHRYYLGMDLNPRQYWAGFTRHMGYYPVYYADLPVNDNFKATLELTIEKRLVPLDLAAFEPHRKKLRVTFDNPWDRLYTQRSAMVIGTVTFGAICYGTLRNLGLLP